MAIEAIVAKAASSSLTDSGIETAKFSGTTLNSEWLAIPAPAIATRSPIVNLPSIPAPISIILPDAEYPSGIGSSNLVRTAFVAALSPSVFTLDNTFFTRSGRCRAFDSIFFFANSATILSVPDEISEALVFTRISFLPT